jgi:hypothetical protein
MDDDFDFGSLDAGPGAADLSGIDLSSLLNLNGGSGIDFSGFDNLDISSLLSGGDNFTPGDFGGSLGSELAAALQDTGNASSLFSGDGGIDVEALLNAQEQNPNLTFNDDTEPGSSGGNQGSEGPAGQGDLGSYDGSSYSKLLFNDDTEPGSSGGTQGSNGPAGDGDLGSYTGSSYTGGGNKKLVFDDDSEPGSSGGSSGSTGVAKKDDLGAYKGSTYDDSGGTKTKVDDKGNVILPDGTKVTPGGVVVPPGTPTPKTPTTPTKTDTTKPAGKDNNMLMMMLALMAMMNKGGGSTGSGGTIPSLQANRSQLPYAPVPGAAAARPGAGGVNYFSPTSYTQKAAGGGMMYGGGGLSDLGGYSDGGRLLKGPGDGVSDSIPATIGGKQPARLATGEFVVPARVVSELGNGSTDAGAKRLYDMMDRVQKARRKTKNVAADTKAHKYLPS